MTKTGQCERSISAIHWPETSGALALGAMFVLAVICASAAQAQTYTVRHKFTGGTDGGDPEGGLGRDSAGNLCGTTAIGGVSGYGVVYKLDKSGETVLYSFTGGADGGYPYSNLIPDSAGNLYGTTLGGGNGMGYNGAGVVFKLDTAGQETVLYSFTGGADGGSPEGGVILDSAGNLYGTTYSSGGTAGHSGVVYKLDTAGSYKVLYSFTGGADGGGPAGVLIRDSAGNLYGATSFGGIATGTCSAGCGVVFKLDTTGTETVLYSFKGYPTDGIEPSAGVVRDSAGNLYGTTYNGGSGLGGSCFSGCGVVYKLDTTGMETVLYNFTGGADGANPYGGLIRDPAGNLYGITFRGGNTLSQGVLFKLDSTGTETVLHTFTGGSGTYPVGVLIRDAAGNLFGTTSVLGASGYGVVFKLKP